MPSLISWFHTAFRSSSVCATQGWTQLIQGKHICYIYSFGSAIRLSAAPQPSGASWGAGKDCNPPNFSYSAHQPHVQHFTNMGTYSAMRWRPYPYRAVGDESWRQGAVWSHLRWLPSDIGEVLLCITLHCIALCCVALCDGCSLSLVFVSASWLLLMPLYCQERSMFWSWATSAAQTK